MTPKPPESTHMAITLWWAIIAVEAIHQVLNVTMGILNRHESAAAALKRLEGGGSGAVNAHIAETTSVVVTVLMGGAALAVVGVLAWLVTKLRTPHVEGTRPSVARRCLALFGWYLAVRGIFTFAVVPTGAVPVALYAVDGSLRIIIGVAGVVAAVLLAQKEAVEWAGETK